MDDFFFRIFALLSEVSAVGSLVSLDAVLPIGAIVAGVAVGVIQFLTATRNKAYDLQWSAIETRLAECERYRDGERAKLEACRQALSDAHIRISELEHKYERRADAGS